MQANYRSTLYVELYFFSLINFQMNVKKFNTHKKQKSNMCLQYNISSTSTSVLVVLLQYIRLILTCNLTPVLIKDCFTVENTDFPNMRLCGKIFVVCPLEVFNSEKINNVFTCFRRVLTVSNRVQFVEHSLLQVQM